MFKPTHAGKVTTISKIAEVTTLHRRLPDEKQTSEWNLLATLPTKSQGKDSRRTAK